MEALYVPSLGGNTIARQAGNATHYWLFLLRQGLRVDKNSCLSPCPRSSEYYDHDLESLRQTHLGPDKAITGLSLRLRPPPLCSSLIEGRAGALLQSPLVGGAYIPVLSPHMGFAHILLYKCMDDLEDLHVARGQSISPISHTHRKIVHTQPDLSPHWSPVRTLLAGWLGCGGSRLLSLSQHPPPAWGQHYVLGFGCFSGTRRSPSWRLRHRHQQVRLDNRRPCQCDIGL